MKFFPYVGKGRGYRAAAENALMESMSLMGQVFGNTITELVRRFIVLLDLRWVMSPRLVFGMMFGVGSNS
jgi:hypothetical protein